MIDLAVLASQVSAHVHTMIVPVSPCPSQHIPLLLSPSVHTHTSLSIPPLCFSLLVSLSLTILVTQEP